MDATDTLRLEQLVLSRGGGHVAGPLDLQLARGERGLVLGPNGSGKTTLVLTIVGAMPPGSGTLLRPQQVGLVPQEPDFPLHLRCADYFRQLLALGAHSATAADVADALRRFGLEAMAGRRIGELSRGWRQRLNLARGWLGRPQLLILDEPQTALDGEGMQDLAAALEDLGDTAVLIVAPDGVGCRGLAPVVLELQP
jgi:ABC-type multidrug transport system ATPase subunit